MGVKIKPWEEQIGFGQGRTTIEQLFTLRNIIEQRAEWNSLLCANFADFEIAFDSIHRESLWLVIKYYGIPDKMQRLVKLLCEQFKSAVFEEWNQSDWFGITTGVTQCSAISGCLFLLSTI